MSFGIGDILQTLQQGVQGLNNLTQQIKATWPQATTASTTIPSSVGALSFSSSQPVGFQLVTLSSGVTVKFPFYNQ